MSIQIIDPSTSGAAGDLLIAVLLDTQDETYRTEFCDLLQNLISNYDPHFQVKWLSDEVPPRALLPVPTPDTSLATTPEFETKFVIDKPDGPPVP